jgi:hypothetical protein
VAWIINRFSKGSLCFSSTLCFHQSSQSSTVNVKLINFCVKCSKVKAKVLTYKAPYHLTAFVSSSVFPSSVISAHSAVLIVLNTGQPIHTPGPLHKLFWNVGSAWLNF